ncbi:phosphatase PAP2/dual specificity phosphatase family protein [Phytopseudomonas punonensis]|uniref:Dual specificity phosphatase, catalytic domain n=1 Tax=Phytopseudomonas punonensis TaxID=1220495 RepID=A0A1M7ASU0_9GAMM|nr:phosphatase PAP2/dual specificity phosphatase family protein [Pseudomonas punonensis]SHL45793.1 Dual specificity phosphatase, catalytic domain [Pseudomonas punonensis]
MTPAAVVRESGLWKRGVLWLLLLAPLFFGTYGFANWFTGQRDDVGSLVFGWERHIPLLPWTIIPYWSIDLLYGLAFLLPATRAAVDRLGLRLLTAQVICISCFLLWPLRFTFERPALDGLFGVMFDVLMGFDKPFNQAPSLHITLLVVLWACFVQHASGFWRAVVHFWFWLIGLSVLTTWQHHFIDVPTGMLAGFLCLWLWPSEGRSRLFAWCLARDPRRWRLALRYAFGAALCSALAIHFGGFALWLLWPALSLLMVALNYTLFDAKGFQKRADGSLSAASTWLLAPYLLGAWINSRAWTREHPQPDEVADGVWLGRIPGKGEAQAFAAIADLCAELPCRVEGKVYRELASLDLIAPSSEHCLQAALAIEDLRRHGPVLVCCALGYSRSATAIAAWLLHSGRCRSVAEAVSLLRQAHPQVVLGDAHLRALEGVLSRSTPTVGGSLHGQ